MISIIIAVTLVYLLLIGSFCLGFDRVKTSELSDMKPKTRFSVIVPFRNEAKELPALLESISRLNYPKERFELIFVDDDSDDDSRNIVETFLASKRVGGANITVIHNVRSTNSPKKDAITLAISKANYDWIVTTDADCVLPKYWLDSFDELIQKQHPDLVVAPITYHYVTGFLQNFQLLDVLSLQGATIGGFGIKKPFLCNGANLAYTKQLFNAVNGFQGNAEVASGDDVFLLEKATRNNASNVHYLKCKHAVVATKALTSTADLLEQRVRWAAKSSAYKNLFGKFAGLIILAQNGLLIASLFLVGIGILKPKELLYIFIIKFSIDFLLIYKSALFFDQKSHLKHYLLASLCYPFFSVYVAFIAVFKGYQWKGRSYRQ
jgi:cellulose synthase/poly-beta-1,6-N-acetylglucosamine synthase-like glycosyltransferase